MEEKGTDSATAPTDGPPSIVPAPVGERVRSDGDSGPAPASRGPWRRSLRLDTPRGRGIHVALATLLALAGLTTAVLAGVSPNYQVSSLATSGTFFALAESGDTIYAASDNGGSVILEKSTDRGAVWTANPVPYSAVAGGAPWDHAAVAADGGRLVLTASHADSSTYFYPYPGPPPVSSGCGSNSTVLLASSPDGGLTWTTTMRLVSNVSVTSLQTVVEGNTTAVTWVGTSAPCGSGGGQAGAITSPDGGRSWSATQAIVPMSAAIAAGPGIEMAPERQGILLAISEMSTLASGIESTAEIGLWQAPLGVNAAFAPVGQLPAPSSWTLQGQPDTPAYLLTPTYLIPLTNLSALTTTTFTAIPFDQLQTDAAGIGSLPNVVSLVPHGATSVEIAATTADNLGVDCWVVDTMRITVERTCHVPLGSFLAPSNQMLPIVALLDGGGWWVAVGASASGCGTSYGGAQPVPPGPTCVGSNPGGSYSGVYNGTPAPVAGSAVGTSVCQIGCSSAAGLAAYSYDPTAAVDRAMLDALAIALVGAGIVWLGLSTLSRRPAESRAEDGSGPLRGRAAETARDSPAGPRTRRLYVAGLAVWVVAWSPVALLALLAGSGLAAAVLPTVIVVGGVIGAVAAAAFHGSVRTRLQGRYGLTMTQLLTTSDLEPRPASPVAVRWASYAAYASWAAGGALLLLTGYGLAGGFDLVRASTPTGGGTTEGPPAGLILSAVLLVVVLLRVAFHVGLALAAAQDGSQSSGAGPSRERAVTFRTMVGAALLPWNPLVGLIFGWALQSFLPFSPYLPAVVFLLVTLLGAAILGGCFGRTLWSTTVRSSPSAAFHDARPA